MQSTIVSSTVLLVFDLLALRSNNIDVTYSRIYVDTFMVRIKPSSALIESDRQYR